MDMEFKNQFKELTRRQELDVKSNSVNIDQTRINCPICGSKNQLFGPQTSNTELHLTSLLIDSYSRLELNTLRLQSITEEFNIFRLKANAEIGFLNAV